MSSFKRFISSGVRVIRPLKVGANAGAGAGKF